MLIYDFILQGHEATEENARAAALGLCWIEVETTERESKYEHSDFFDSVNGIDIYYNYGTNCYYFVEPEETTTI